MKKGNYAMKGDGPLNCNFIESKYIHQKNISYNYTINYYCSMKALGGSKTQKLSNISSNITDGTRVKRIYAEQGVRIINVGDFKDGQVYLESLKRISKNGLKEKDYIKENDILITAVGKSGQVIRVTPHLEDAVISSDIIRVRLKQPSTAVGLVAYLNSEAGQFALEAIKSGLIHRISINDIKNLEVPKYFRELVMDNSLTLKNKEEESRPYKDCMKIFNRYITQNEDLFKIPKFTYIISSKLDSDRLDPKHYTYGQGKLFKTIQRNTDHVRWQSLGEVVEIKRAIRPSMDEKQEVDYINISNVDADTSLITSNEKDLFKNLSSRIRYVLEENEIITAKSGSATGTQNHVSAVVTKKHAGMMASDAFHNIKAIDIDPYYLLFLLKQTIILKQIDAGSTGLSFKTINKKEFEDIRIPRLGQLEEEQIGSLMKKHMESQQRE